MYSGIVRDRDTRNPFQTTYYSHIKKWIDTTNPRKGPGRGPRSDFDRFPVWRIAFQEASCFLDRVLDIKPDMEKTEHVEPRNS